MGARALYDNPVIHQYDPVSRRARLCKELGVSAVFIGYPRGIARDKPGKGNTNLWSYRKLEQRIAVTAENRGISVFKVPEDNTSKVCARHGCEV